MEKSILYDIEIRHGAKMVEKTGITFPKVFSTVNIETSSVREKCVMFDMADKCKILITGKDAIQFIEFLSTVNIVPTFGSIYKTMFLYNNGKILDIVKVYYFNNQTLMIIIGINSFESTLSFMTNLSNGFDVNIIRINDECHQISLIGKLAKEVVSDELNINLDDLEKNEFVILDRDCKVIVYHEENQDVTIRYLPYDGTNFYRVDKNGEMLFLTDKRAVDDTAKAFVEMLDLIK